MFTDSEIHQYYVCSCNANGARALESVTCQYTDCLPQQTIVSHFFKVFPPLIMKVALITYCPTRIKYLLVFWVVDVFMNIGSYLSINGKTQGLFTASIMISSSVINRFSIVSITPKHSSCPDKQNCHGSILPLLLLDISIEPSRDTLKATANVSLTGHSCFLVFFLIQL